MSAWAQLVNADGSDEHLDLCNRALIEIQTEHPRRLAAKQRTAADDLDRALGARTETASTMRRAADLIDPEVSK